MRVLAFALLWGLSLSALADAIPTRIAISYSIRSGALEGEANDTLEIKQENGTRNYAISSAIRALGLLALAQSGNILRDSVGTITEQGLQPSRFFDQRPGKLPRVSTFDWEKGLLTINNRGSEQQKPLPIGTQDRLSFLYCFAFSPPPNDGPLEVYETDGRTLKLVHYVVDKETLKTPIGELETIVLTKLLHGDDKLVRKIWLAPAYYMLPVRIVSTESDLLLDHMVTRISYGDASGLRLEIELLP
jgi:hypothetical protein